MSARESLRAPVNKIIPFSLVDGLGSRCAIFLQGCNISCVYCHNPETQALCCACGACVSVCPGKALSLREGQLHWDKAACIDCDSCIHICPHRASPKVRWYSADEMLATVRSYQPFIRGITVSGGECMLHAQWLHALFERCRSVNLGTLIDSNATVDFSKHAELLSVCDGVMLDVKAWESEVFLRLTGGHIETVKRNLIYLAQHDKIEELRIVVVDGWNDPERTIAGIADALSERVKATRLKLIRFRNFGVIGPLAHAPSPSDARMAALEHHARECGFGEVELR